MSQINKYLHFINSIPLAPQHKFLLAIYTAKYLFNDTRDLDVYHQSARYYLSQNCPPEIENPIDSAIDILTECAEKKHLPSLILLAEIYNKPRYGRIDKTIARDWYMRASELRDSNGAEKSDDILLDEKSRDIFETLANEKTRNLLLSKHK
jgi:TPR repeat protein